MTEFICEKCKNKVSAEPDQNGCFRCPVCGVTLSVDQLPEDVLIPGTMVGGFEVKQLIASGGMGNIYLARQLSMERNVALKILRKNLVSDPDNAERFLSEARTTAKFQNTHVVPVIDAGQADGYCYIAMQYVEGETIETRLNRGTPFPQDRALQICITVADALSSIWKKFGMFHKDIKPSNIILTAEEEPMILDMGIAQHSGASILENGEIEGSPFYMSPEQAQGGSLTWSTDLYSLGITMYNMLTGVLPYEDPDMRKIMEMHVSSPFPEPEEKVPGLGLIPEVTLLLRKMMAKNPEDRFDSWESFISEAKSARNRYWKLCKEKEKAPENTNTKKISPAELFQEKKEPVIQKEVLSWKRLVLLFAGTILTAGLVVLGIYLYRNLQKNDRVAQDYVLRLTAMAASRNPNIPLMKDVLSTAEAVSKKNGVKPSRRNNLQNIRINLENYEKSLKEEKELFLRLNASEETFKQSSASAIKDSLQRISGKQFADEKLQDLLNQLKTFQAELNSIRPVLSVNRKNLSALRKSNHSLIADLTGQYNLEKSERIKYLAALKNQKQTAKAVPAKTVPQKPQGKPAPAAAPAKEVVPAKKVLVQQKQNLPAKPPSKTTPSKKTAVKKSVEKAEKEIIVQPAGEQQIKDAIILNAMILLRKGAVDEMKNLFSGEGLSGSVKTDSAAGQWLEEMREPAEQAAMLMKVLYHSRNTFRGASVWSARYGKKMKIGSIQKNEVILYTAGAAENDRITFDMIPMSDWYDLVTLAAKKYRLQRNLPAFFCFHGDFAFRIRTNSAVLKRELPGMKKLFYRYISGERIPGAVPDQITISPSMLQGFQEDKLYRQVLQKKNGAGANQGKD